MTSFGYGTFGGGTFGGLVTPLAGPSPGASPGGSGIEALDYVTPDGEVYPFNISSRIGRWVFTESGWGLPPIEYITQRGPFQHGDTVKDFFLRPRTVQLLIRSQFCNRPEYWAGRANLLDAIRPNRQRPIGQREPGVLRKRMPDGSFRCLDVFIAQGPIFEPRKLDQWDEHAFQEVLRFVAYNPVVYNPANIEQVFAPDAQLTFPITFPITFGSIHAIALIQYFGSWNEYPGIVLTGPMISPRIENVTTGEVLQFAGVLTMGQVVTIDLSPGVKSVLLGDGTNWLGHLTPESNLGVFHIETHPGALDGINEIKVDASGASSTSSVVFNYKTRYIGV